MSAPTDIVIRWPYGDDVFITDEVLDSLTGKDCKVLLTEDGVEYVHHATITNALRCADAPEGEHSAVLLQFELEAEPDSVVKADNNDTSMKGTS